MTSIADMPTTSRKKAGHAHPYDMPYIICSKSFNYIGCIILRISPLKHDKGGL